MLNILKKNLNNNFKSLPFKLKQGKISETKYLPPFSIEWKDTVYSYNIVRVSNFMINNLYIYKMIRNYFLMSFKGNWFINSKHTIRKYKPYILKRIYITKPNIKYTNSKVIITLFSFNIKKNYFFYNKYKELNRYINSKILIWYKKFLQKKIDTLRIKLKLDRHLYEKELIVLKYNMVDNLIKIFNFYLKIYLYLINMSKHKVIKHLYYNKLIPRYRKFQYMYYIYKYKFEAIKLLPVLTRLINKYMDKKIEYNIINLKSIVYSPYIFTKALSLKLRKKNIRLGANMDTILGKAKIFKENNLIERTSVIRSNDPNCLISNHNLLSSLKKYDDLNRLLHNINSEDNMLRLTFDNIKYKKIRGIKLLIKGRLTKRYRADKTVYRLKLRGGLRNEDASFKKLSSVMYRGYKKSNIIYSVNKGKRRIGAFAVKGWIAGK